MGHSIQPPAHPDYVLLDAGGGRRLERFGPRVVDRPAATALAGRRDPNAWLSADLRFDDGRWWAAARPVQVDDVEPWPVEIEGLTMAVRPTASGGVGLYPEHAANLAWLREQIGARVGGARGDRDGDERADRDGDERADRDTPPAVLNLFAHTGLVTLAAARAGAAVTHVDAARGAVAWARSNAAASDLAGHPIRWITDDAAGYVAREARRGRRYDGIVLDPPSFGRAGGRRWRLVDELPALLAACQSVAADGTFVLLTAHTTGLDGGILSGMLRDAFPGSAGRSHAVELGLVSDAGERLDLGWAVRMAP